MYPMFWQQIFFSWPALARISQLLFSWREVHKEWPASWVGQPSCVILPVWRFRHALQVRMILRTADCVFGITICSRSRATTCSCPTNRCQWVHDYFWTTLAMTCVARVSSSGQISRSKQTCCWLLVICRFFSEITKELHKYGNFFLGEE